MTRLFGLIPPVAEAVSFLHTGLCPGAQPRPVPDLVPPPSLCLGLRALLGPALVTRMNLLVSWQLMLFLCAISFRDTLEKVAPMENPRATGTHCPGERREGASEWLQNEIYHTFQTMGRSAGKEFPMQVSFIRDPRPLLGTLRGGGGEGGERT